MRASLLLLIAVLAAGAAPAQAADKGLETSLLVGSVTPLTKIQLIGSDRAAGSGVEAGARVLKQAGPSLKLGGEVDSLMPTGHSSPSLVPGATTESRFSSLLFLGEAKLGPTDGSLRPFALAGVGGHWTTMKIDVTPDSGFAWADTGTTEERRVIDSTRLTVALTLQAGVDFDVTDNVTLGLAGAWYYLGSNTYSPTDGGLTLGAVNTALTTASAVGSLTYRF